MISKLTRLCNIINEDESEKIKKKLSKLIPNDIDFKYNGNIYPKHQLILFHIISDYHLAYTKSKDNEKQSRINTLESLGKGNIKRKARVKKNNEIIKDKSSSSESRIIAVYENLILKRIIKGDYKFAYLILTYLLISQSLTLRIQKKILLFNGKANLIIKAQEKAFEFFDFTYLQPSKIVNSCAIAINQYLKTCVPTLSEEERLKFVRNIINIHFSKDAPSSLRADFFKRDIYCAGRYNSTPIFQWHTSTINESYYSDKDIAKYFRITNLILKNMGLLNKLIVMPLIKKEHQKEANEHLTNEKLFRKVIESTSIGYVQNPNKLLMILNQNYKKTFKDYIKLPFQIINTIFVALITKFTLK